MKKDNVGQAGATGGEHRREGAKDTDHHGRDRGVTRNRFEGDRRMNTQWDQVPIGDILTRAVEEVDILADQTYRLLTVGWWGKGVVERKIACGSEISSAKLSVVSPNDFIISRIDARKGACDVIAPEFKGSVVTNDFPVYRINTERLLPTFLKWLSKTERFIGLCNQASEGTTNRVRLQEDRFLARTISVPPLPEQRRIVVRVEELAGKIAAAKRLRDDIARSSNDFLGSVCFAHASPTSPTPMHTLVRLREPDVFVIPEESYRFAGVFCFGRGVFRGDSKQGMEFSYRTLTRLRAGNFVYPKLMAWEGAFGLVPQDCDGLVLSPEFPVFEIDEQRVLPEVLEVYFRMPFVWDQIKDISAGTNVRRKRLQPDTFLNYQIPLPPMPQQQRLRDISQKFHRATEWKQEQQRELDGLLPSILDKAFRGEL
jgi:type I restriction enzyme, S subunit